MAQAILGAVNGSYSLVGPGPASTVALTIPPTTPVVGRASIWFTWVSNAPGSDLNTYTVIFTPSVGTPIIVVGPRIGAGPIINGTSGQPGFGFASHNVAIEDTSGTGDSVALGGTISLDLFFSPFSGPITDDGACAAVIIQADSPPGFQMRPIEEGGFPFFLGSIPSVNSATMDVPYSTGPFITLIQFVAVGGGVLSPVTFTPSDPAISLSGLTTVAANNVTIALADFVSYVNGGWTTALWYLVFDFNPAFTIDTSWSSATSTYGGSPFIITHEPIVPLPTGNAGDLWLWGYASSNIPKRVSVIDLPSETFVKVCDYGAGGPLTNSLVGDRFMCLSATGNVYAWDRGQAMGFAGGARTPPIAGIVPIYNQPNPSNIDFATGLPNPPDLVAGLPQGTIVDIGSTFQTALALDDQGNLWAWQQINDSGFDVGPTPTNPSWPAPGGNIGDPTPFITQTNVAAFYTCASGTLVQKTNGQWWVVGLFGSSDGLPSVNQGNFDLDPVDTVRLPPGRTFATFHSSGGFNSLGVPVFSTWQPSPAYTNLPNTVKVVTVGDFQGVDAPVLLIQANGTVYALGGATTQLFGTFAVNYTGIPYGFYVWGLVHAGPSGFSFVFDLTILDDPIQLPWASNIVDASISIVGNYALYLDSAGSVFVVANNVNYTAGSVWGADLQGNIFAPVISSPTFPPTVTLPTGVIATGLLAGGGGIIGSDGRLYTVGPTPDGSLTLAVLLTNNPLTNLYGTPGFGGFGQPYQQGFPPVALSLSGLSNVVGGLAESSFRVFAIAQSASSTAPFVPPPVGGGTSGLMIAGVGFGSGKSGHAVRSFGQVVR